MIKKQGTILIVDDNRNILTTVRMLLDPIFHNIITIANPNSIPAKLREEHPDVVLLDMNFSSGINSGNEGLFWLREIKSISPKTEVVLFTAYADIQLAVTGIKEGAADFIVKPFDNEKMIGTLLEARDKNKTADKAMGKHSGKAAQSVMYWGDSEAMTNLRHVVEKVAATDANILITGENGTGKEVLANEIHRLSARSCKKMLPVDMGAISETLFESELFGHVKGAFTDAKVDKPGKFELADGSTIFLDEIGNLSYSLQAKLLTALQRRSIVRVGGSTQIPINVRLVCATNRNLQQMVNDGEFREDLLYRINTIHLELPALRQRKADIVPLANRFLRQYGDMYNKTNLRFSDEAEKKLISLPWYGNIRELQHAIEKAVILSDGGMISAEDIDGGNQTRREKPLEEVQTLDEMESRMIEKTIKECEGNLSVVAARLGISRQTLYNKIKRYGI
ncbi:MAG: sigma-54 dependent transcriptional regulator [Prevotella sp.]|uniref:sigma-54-dependent transcriptional regulator n=1 Tax=Leyella stercorea TaxID=363265 RepID=UPI001F394539|nr:MULTISPECIES: sigma-54 dependent transcriptional regulator [Prevotellaceae]MCF2577613.1 sigma-54-dependent Fis family transcriptional regulator [Leyella stercorea]MCI7184354.1 sigma-54 dependent transcriptional regulator [Prevotella sp.]